MSKKKWFWCLLVSVILGLFVICFLIVDGIPEPLFPDDYSKLVLDEHGQILRVFLNKEEQWILPDDGRDIPFRLRTAVIQYEDKRFEKHWGIDPFALGRAVYQNIVSRSRISGASTITMQVARLMQPKPRTIRNKLIEMVQAVAFEFKYTKDEILKLYLLHAPYGSNIIGYRTASLRYFGKEPENLSWAEAAVLAVLPNNPANINPMQNQDKLKEKRDGLLKNLFESGLIDHTAYTLAAAEPIPQGQYSFTLSAPHLAEKLARNCPDSIIKTTIDKTVQDKVTSLVKEYVNSLGHKGVKNGAVLVTDTATGHVKAYAASQDYLDNSNLGKIDGIQMSRSAGSTLKPFLYALAMDQGLIIPESVIPDIPASYGGYTPYNADRSFSGLVRADKALIRSLNAPAVYLLNQYGLNNFYRFFQSVGLNSLNREANDYGLSIILGSLEISLWELSRLYHGLANYGEFLDQLIVSEQVNLNSQSVFGKKRLITPGSAYLVLDILKEVERPGLDYYWREYQSGSPVAWKTGTSYGNRDAWAVGVSPQWVIAVWVGNFSGEEVSGLSGIDSAAPLLFQVFAQLGKNSYQKWFLKPENELKEIAVSKDTGYRLQGETSETKMALASVAALPLEYSPYEKVLFLNGSESMQVCSLCWDRDDMRTVRRLIYPPYISLYFAKSGVDYSLPPHNPDCPALKRENSISFIYPKHGSYIFIPKDIDGEYQKITLQIAHGEKESRIFWYLDDSYLTETVDNHQVSILLETGWHQLYVVDGVGNSKSISFYSERR
ncbi:MAG: penicillin-binding protein 1C [Firmicutes bacterium]|nr:penicillin-binding protein 1C [Bacillota bacterium]